MEEKKICKNPECRKIIKKEEWISRSYGNEEKWQKLRYCSGYCRGRSKYLRKLKEDKK